MRLVREMNLVISLQRKDADPFLPPRPPTRTDCLKVVGDQLHHMPGLGYLCVQRNLGQLLTRFRFRLAPVSAGKKAFPTFPGAVVRVPAETQSANPVGREEHGQDQSLTRVVSASAWEGRGVRWIRLLPIRPLTDCHRTPAGHPPDIRRTPA